MYKDSYRINYTGVVPELRLRHLTVNEALPEINDFLDKAFRDGARQVKIIHGKGGTGIIRDTVRDILRKHPLVKSFRSGGKGEGSAGVTIVDFTDR